MKARIYKPTRNAMQSGEANTRHWALEFMSSDPLFVEPLMGWTGQTDTIRQIQLYFESKEEAIAYAKGKGIDFEVTEPKSRTIKPKSYAANFSFKQVE
jgi:hypothetical protein